MQTVRHSWTGENGENMVPVRIPWTKPTSYLSFLAALNLRMPDEHAENWHHSVPFFTPADHPQIIKFPVREGWCTRRRA